MTPRILATLASLAAALLAAGCQPSPDKLAARYTEVVKGYCLDCHDAAGQEGGLSLEAVDLNKVAEHADIFEKVARKCYLPTNKLLLELLERHRGERPGSASGSPRAPPADARAAP